MANSSELFGKKNGTAVSKQETDRPQRRNPEHADDHTARRARVVVLRCRATSRGRRSIRSMWAPPVSVAFPLYERRSSVITSGRLHRLQDGRRRSRLLVAARDGHRHLKYFRKANLHGDRTRGAACARSVTPSRTRSAAPASSSAATSRRRKTRTFESSSPNAVHQMGAFNSPVWFHCGLFHEYGIRLRRQLGLNMLTTRSRRRRTPTPARSARRASSRPRTTTDEHLRARRTRRVSSSTAPAPARTSARSAASRRSSPAAASSGLMSSSRSSIAQPARRRAAAPRARSEDGVPGHGYPGSWTSSAGGPRGKEARPHRRLPSDFNGEAYHTISGQNSNSSIRVTDEFMRAALAGGVADDRPHDGRSRRHARREGPLASGVRPRGDRRPGRQYDSDQPLAHVPEHGAHQRVEPVLSTCSSTTRLQPVEREPDEVPRGQQLRRRRLRHAYRIFFIAQEILVDLSSYPTANIAKDITTTARSAREPGVAPDAARRPVRQRARPCDRVGAHRERVRSRLQASAEMAKTKGPFAGYAKNREPMLRVMNMHRDAATASTAGVPEDLTAPRAGLGSGRSPRGATERAGDRARADRHHRSAHGRDTTGIEPDARS